ncbi:hypothetical protein [uncultured Draconibacterium sp.]|uniref:hypothetical protein n=1 Tax=uncultured Draconibacterium sp. TaxID=1573823 RepID=UPI0025D7C830|nr:hypothetical protein [uncultured Draconibacterium sp.]
MSAANKSVQLGSCSGLLVVCTAILVSLLRSFLAEMANIYHPTAVNAVPPSWEEGKLGLWSISFVIEI